MIVNKIKYIALIFFVLVLSACEKEIEIEVKEGVDKMVLNGWFQVGEVPEIKINNSIFIFDRRNSRILTDATVNLFLNGELLGELIYDFDKELYTNKAFVIVQDGNYEILVEHVAYGIVKSVIQIPTKLSPSEVNIQYKNFIIEENSFPSYSGEIQISIKDPAAEKNYYLVSVLLTDESWYPNVSEDTIYRYTYDTYLGTNNNQVKVIYQYGGGALILLSDEVFNGNEYSLKLNSYNDLRKDVQTDDSTYYLKREYQIQLHQVNEAFYKYYISLDDNRYPDVFTEPTQVFSNIENGYGIIGASTKHIKNIEQSRNEE
jgi:hypothetical protein